MAIDDVLDKKLAAMEALPSQFYEGGANGGPQLVPSDDAGQGQAEERGEGVVQAALRCDGDEVSRQARELYGAQRGDAAKAAEAFEISEYGRRPNAEEIKKLFPFF